MTLQQLIDRVNITLRMGASGTHGVEEQETLTQLANEAVVDLLSRCRINTRSVEITLTAGVQEYEITGNVLQLNNLFKGTTEVNEVSAGDAYRVGTNAYSVVGYNRIALGWIPAVGDDPLVAWYTPKPTAMADGADDPATAAFGGIPVEFHSALVNYMLWRAADIVGDTGSGRGERYRVLYEGQDGAGGIGSDIGRIRTQINRRVSSGSGARRLPRSGEIRVTDVDPGYFRG
jgi:hypothetical protein